MVQGDHGINIFLQMGQASIEFFSIAFSLSNQLPMHRILLWFEKVFDLLYLVLDMAKLFWFCSLLSVLGYLFVWENCLGFKTSIHKIIFYLLTTSLIDCFFKVASVLEALVLISQ